jgi:transcriptional regulator with XRE-family HTH domain
VIKNAWSRYIDATSMDDLNFVIAEKVGVDPATVGRWRTGATDPKPRQVVAYARAYGLSPLQALVAAEFLSEEELGMSVGAPKAYALTDFASVDLAEELLARLERLEGYVVETRVGEATVHRVLDGRELSAPLDPAEALPYIGRLSREDMPAKLVADKKTKRADSEPAAARCRRPNR